MVNDTVFSNSLLKLDDVLTKEQVYKIVKESSKNGNNWEVSFAEVGPASDGLIGFLGDHLRVTLHVNLNGCMEKIHLFIKRVPSDNKPKAEFIDKNGFYRREQLMFQLIEEMRAVDGLKPWCVKALINTETLLVMRDVSIQGYSTRPPLESFDLPHTLTAVTSIAHYHADLTNYLIKRSNNENQCWTFLQQYGHILCEPTFKDSPWLRCAAKLASNLIKTFSNKYNNLPDLESRIVKKIIEGCDSLKEYNNTLNVLIHKDLWANNIMFRYEKGAPCHALLVDFQCIRYAPPVYDLTSLLYLTTCRGFRELHEKVIYQHYYTIFIKNLKDYAKRELKCLGYDEENFLSWCEKSRMFSLGLAICILPYGLMDPKIAQKTFNNPEIYDKYLVEDRTDPVLAHCNESEQYMLRQLENCEEFLERYILSH